MRKTILTLAVLTGFAMGATDKSTCDSSVKVTEFLSTLILNHKHEVFSGTAKIYKSNKHALPYCIKAYGKNSNVVKGMKKNIKAFKYSQYQD